MNSGESFIAHLVELRTRLLNAVVAVLVVFVCLFPWASDLYTLLARPMLARLPKGGQMIATDVTTPFFVPLKVALMTAFLIALPYILYQIWRFDMALCRARFIRTRKAPGVAADHHQFDIVFLRHGIRLFCSIPRCVRFHHLQRAAGCGSDDRHR